MRKFSLFFIFSIILAIALIFARQKVSTLTNTNMDLENKSEFHYNFEETKIIDESSTLDQSKDESWWLTSGGIFTIKEGVGKTTQGSLPDDSKWRLAYLSSSPVDTDLGFHPQNIFRLLTKQKWQNFSQEICLNIKSENLSESPNRNQSNGIFLLNRYRDRDNLYYAGIRVDGAAVIKKKINGVYQTIAYKKYFSQEDYNRDTNPNLLPKNTWIGIRSEVRNNPDASVKINLYINNVRDSDNWNLILEVVDDGKSFGEKIISEEGYAGIRTDFMDVEFDNFQIKELK